MRSHVWLIVTVAVAIALVASSVAQAQQRPQPRNQNQNQNQPRDQQQQQPRRDRNITDADLTDRIERELENEQGVNLNDIDVKVNDGVVTLSGEIDSLREEDLAVRTAETVRGVKDVKSEFNVRRQQGMNNQQVQQRLNQAFKSDQCLQQANVNAQVQDGTVTLTGEVQHPGMKRLAEQKAMNVRGVQDIKNNITVKRTTDRNPQQLTQDIQTAWRDDARLDESQLRVEVDEQGRARLSGNVPTAADRRRAVIIAMVPGIQDVDDTNVSVQGGTRSQQYRDQKFRQRQPDQIKQSVENALMRNPRVYSFNITPTVQDDGTVILRGTVDNLRAKRTAAQVARDVVGVQDVQNRIRVRQEQGQRTRPEDLKTQAEQALEGDTYLTGQDIEVSVNNDTVTLSGDVDTAFEKRQAEESVSSIPGVADVRNRIEVRRTDQPLTYDPYVYEDQPEDYSWYDFEPAPTMESDAEIREEIVDELWWSPFVDEDEVRVTVENGVATLTGTVDSWSERSAATENAYEGGAVWVQNNLRVE